MSQKCLILWLLLAFCLLQASYVDGQNRRGARNRNRNRGRNRNRNPNRRRPTTTATPAAMGECEPLMAPMCRGQVPYNMTRLPNQFGHQTQSQATRALEAYWPYMDINCSKNFRILACAIFLPKCLGEGIPSQLPCKATCRVAKSKCQYVFNDYRVSWPTRLKCIRLPTTECVGPVVDPVLPAGLEHTRCERNLLPICQNLTMNTGFLPNMFLQKTQQQIGEEMDQFRDLFDSHCSEHLPFFMCGIYMPFCVNAEVPFSLPCSEVCEEVEQRCTPVLQRIYRLLWPSKFECQRYPSAASNGTLGSIQCAIPPNWSNSLAQIVRPGN